MKPNKIQDDVSLQAKADAFRYWITKKEGHVYLLRCQTYFKIGVAKNVEERLQAHQISNPYPIIYIGKFWCLNAKKSEAYLHQKFNNKRVRGEWYLLDLEDVKKIQKYGDKEYNKYTKHWKDVAEGKKPFPISYTHQYGFA